MGGQIPTMAFASEDLPEPLAPTSARPAPAVRPKETLRTIKRLDPGGATVSFCTHRCLAGEGRVTAGADGEAIVQNVSLSLLTASRAETSCFQVPRTISIGASARPIMIEDAIMIPPLAWSATTSAAPRPRIADWRT